jgi:CTP:molybdopterin cytidylyltransferase MocA
VRTLRQGGADHVIVVLSNESQAALKQKPVLEADQIILNPNPKAGRTGSILLALDALPSTVEACLIHPCDIPLLSPHAITQLLKAWKTAPEPAKTLARLVTPGGRGGHPLLVPKERLSTLRKFAPGQSLRDLVHENSEFLLNVPLAGDPGPFLDVDTPEQLQLLESLLRTSS